ncbi:MAG TPA: HAD family hydrolase [Bacillota bacterium]|nr:HAD family hydrolase [Bacillota bacterium]
MLGKKRFEKHVRGDVMNNAIFLDRDGVINEVKTSRVRFVNQPADFHLLPGVGQAIKMFNDAKWCVFVVTNQGGVGLGYMKETSLKAIHQKMEADLADAGAKVDAIRYCPHKPHANCACRKPKPQMITDLAVAHDVDVKASYMVGDREPDIEAGKKAGTQTVLVGDRLTHNIGSDWQFPDLLAFATWLVK